jgi:hypothetical protein
MGQVLQLPHAFVHGLRVASKHLRDILYASIAESESFDGGKAATILFGEALVVLTSLLFDVWAVGLLKVKRHAASSVRQVFQAMQDTGQEVLLNCRNNTSPIYRDIILASCLSGGVRCRLLITQGVEMMPMREDAWR